MGVGVFWMRDAETVIIDQTEIYGEWDAIHPYGYADIHTAMDFIDHTTAFIVEVCALLPPSWSAVAEHWRDDRSLIIAENGFYQLCFTNGETDFYLSVALRRHVPTDAYHPLARFHHLKSARAVFRRLAARYPLWVRTGLYTRARYDPRA